MAASVASVTSAAREEEGEQQQLEEDLFVPSHHPSVPPDELFDISTTVDTSYVISLIRKLLAVDAKNVDNTEIQESNCNDEVASFSNANCKSTEIVDDFSKSDFHGEDEEDSLHGGENARVSAGKEVWEECGRVLWDIAANQTRAELMVQNLVLEVLLANLMVTQSVRVTEICLGILGNLVCHEVPMKHIFSTNGLIAVIVDQLFLDDTQCLCEAFRYIGFLIPVKLLLMPESIMTPCNMLGSDSCRILWVTENKLNPQLIEKVIPTSTMHFICEIPLNLYNVDMHRSVGLLLAMLESPKEVEHILLSPLMKIGLVNVLVNLLAFEMSKLTNERTPESNVIKLLHILSLSLDILVCTRLYDAIENVHEYKVSNSCVTAGVLIANILPDLSDLASDLSRDFPFLQGLFDVFPFTSDDLEARCALWRLLVRVREDEMSASSLSQYVFILLSKSDLIDDLFDHRFDKNKENESLATCGRRSNSRILTVYGLGESPKSDLAQYTATCFCFCMTTPVLNLRFLNHSRETSVPEHYFAEEYETPGFLEEEGI
ncbi:hypothetical protein CRYUN_Cryun03dG0146000 [Craigia yunnanensis]